MARKAAAYQKNNHMKIKSRQTIWEGDFLRIVRIVYQDHRGVLQNLEAVERVNHPGVIVVVPFTKDKEFVFIRQFRPIINRYVITFPAGLIDGSESAFDAAKRELIEETGYASEKFVVLSEGPESSGMSTAVMTILLAVDAEPASDSLKKQNPPDENENIETIKIPADGIYTAIEKFQNNGDYIDLKIYGLVEISKLKINNDGIS